MIEVEKTFQPTDEQLKALLEDAEFLGEIVNHDRCFDYSDFKLWKKKVKLRNRNGNFELKISLSDNSDKEIEDEEEIKNYLGIQADLEQFVSRNLVCFVDYKSTRRKYKKEGFNIDVDSLDYGLKVCDAELMVENETEVLIAEERINSFLNTYGIVLKKVPGKRREYLKIFKPGIYKELYGEK